MLILSFSISVVASPEIRVNGRLKWITPGSDEVLTLQIQDERVQTLKGLESILKSKISNAYPEVARLTGLQTLAMKDIAGNWGRNDSDGISWISSYSIMSPLEAILLDDTGAYPTTATQRMPPMLVPSIFTLLHLVVSSNFST
eukprot:GHVU01018288.1.p1 GENE.GHVU01018288.1~~GHVU01018288.1.p1  ORF type:complete len:143 (-),score=6.51 GHVU01018288.1:19-447(-)